MVQPQEETIGNRIRNIRLSTVGSSRPTEPAHAIHNPTMLDLAMKLHYIKAVYFFTSEAARDLTVAKIKESFFYLFNDIFWTVGRFRRNDDGRPFIKCNDCGVRFVEETCDLTVEEWLGSPDRSIDEMLVFHKPIGPELPFSPLIYITVTRFKCEGISLGLSWAHVLGDPFSLSSILNKWSDILSRLQVQAGIRKHSFRESGLPNLHRYEGEPVEPVSIKRVEPVGDLWVTPNNRKMKTFSFNLTAAQTSEIQSKVSAGNSNTIPKFESLCAMIWKCIARVREFPEPKTVTIIKQNASEPGTRPLSNHQTISSVQANFDVADADLLELANSLTAQATNEESRISETVEKDNGVSDFVIYGVNLTFVALFGADLYGMKVKGHPPRFVYYNIHGVGDEGMVLVMPASKGEGEMVTVTVTVTVPEEEVMNLISELKTNDLLFEESLE